MREKIILKGDLMKKKVLAVLVLIAVVGSGVLLLKNQKKAQPQIKVSDKPVFTIQESRKVDLGFKLKLDECFEQDQKQYILVDVDNNDTYVLAEAKQYFVGPHPIKEEELIKKNIKEYDQLSVSKLDCALLEQKLTSVENSK